MDSLGHCASCLEAIDPSEPVMFGVVFGVPTAALHLRCGFELLERWRAARAAVTALEREPALRAGRVGHSAPRLDQVEAVCPSVSPG